VENARRVPSEAKSADLQQLTPLPIFRLRQMVSTVIARDGQTVVLVGGSDQLLANPNKNEPLREGTKAPQQPKKTKLLIFITPTLIDAAGNRVIRRNKFHRGSPREKARRSRARQSVALGSSGATKLATPRSGERGYARRET